MSYCPLTKEQCTYECAWFKKSRRRYPDGHVEGKCLVVDVGECLKEVSAAIKSLEDVIIYKDFSC